MKNRICLSCIFLFSMFTIGCSLFLTESGVPLTRMIVSNSGEESIVVVDLYSTLDIRSYPVPFIAPIGTNVPMVEIHPWGAVVFVARATETHCINAESGEVVSPTVITDIRMEMLKALPNGLYFVGSEVLAGQVISQGTITDVRSEVTLTGRDITDIAVCDDNATILVANQTVAPYHSYITKLNINESGVLSNSGQELELSVDNYIMQVDCAAGSGAGVAINSNNNELHSFTIDPITGFEQVDTQDAVVNGPGTEDVPILQAIVFSPDGTELYARLSSTSLMQGWIEKFAFNPSTAQITPTSDWLANIPYTALIYEKARITMDPEGDVIYVPDPDASAIRVVRTSDGSEDSSITDSLINSPGFISAGRVSCFDPNGYGCR